MKFNNKFITIGLIAGIMSLSMGANANAANIGNACLIDVSTNYATIMINTQNVEYLSISKRNPELLEINALKSSFQIKYESAQKAQEGLVELTNKISDCQYIREQKREEKNKQNISAKISELRSPASTTTKVILK